VEDKSMRRNLIGHCQDGDSDKIYMLCIKQEFDGKFSIIGKHNRSGCHLISEIKQKDVSDEFAAFAMADKMFRAKIKKGYQDIESPVYTGPVKKEELKRFLEPESGMSGPSIDEKGNFEVLCLSNFGMEDRFDKGITYLARACLKDKKMFEVENKLGKWEQCFKNRFKAVDSDYAEA
jgi:hypothetical protein